MSENTSPTLADSRRKAQSLGLRIQEPQPNQIFIDIDNDEDFETYETNLEILRDREYQKGRSIHAAVKVSKSGLPNRHIVLTFQRAFHHLERIAYQATLGSDRKHELLSLFAAEAGHTAPTLFFEKP